MYMRNEWADTGLEHPAKTPEKQPPAAPRGTESGTLNADSGPDAPISTPPPPPDVADLARRLAALPEAMRQAIVATLRAAVKED